MLGANGAEMQTTSELIELFRQGAKHLSNMASNLDFPWSPDVDDPRKLHNVYARNLITCYVSKYAQLCETILLSVDNKNYMTYALAGRSLIEITATLRYYVHFKYRPLLDRGALTLDEMKELIEIDDRHLRGGRFDWESFLFQRYEKLMDDAVKYLGSKSAKQKKVVEGIIAEQVNVLTCIEKWANDSPLVLVAYNLFCDLVHPNIGSSFLVASTCESGIYFTPSKGRSVGADIFEQSFPILLAVTHEQFSESLLQLIGTIWQDDEL
jgi:hypothetical protein